MSQPKKYTPSIYFKGKARVKFVYTETTEKKTLNPVFVLDHLYDLYISETEEVNALIYNHVTSKIKTKKPIEYSTVTFQGNTYEIEVIGLKFITIPKVTHEQHDDHQIIGEFDWSEVMVRVPERSLKSGEVLTDHQKEEDGILYEEVILNNGTKDWQAIKAPKGKLTGRIQRKEDLYRSEHYYSNGKTYWGPWTVKRFFKLPEKLKTGPTGLTKKENGMLYKQILREDLTFEWVKAQYKAQLNITATIVVILLMLGFFGFLYYLSNQSEGRAITRVVLPLAVSFFVVVPLINYLLKTAAKLRNILVQLNWVILTLFTTSVVVYFLSSSITSLVNDPCSKRYGVDFPPSYGWKFTQENKTLTTQFNWTDELSATKHSYHSTISWNQDSLCLCILSNSQNNIPFKTRYKNLIDLSELYLKNTRDRFKKEILAQCKHNSDSLAYVNAVVSFIQSRIYRDVIGFEDLLSPAEVMFGLSEDKVTFKADCDDRTVTAFFLLKDPNDAFEFAVFNYNQKDINHSVLGISSRLVSIDPSMETVKVNGKSFLLWELTTKNYSPGQAIRINGKSLDKSVWKMVLSESDFYN
jgi:hypothetical protein